MILVVSVADLQTGSPLPGAEVWLAEIPHVERSDGQGIVRFDRVPAGDYHLHVRRLTYASFDVELALAAGDSVKAAVVLRSSVQRLSTVTITGNTVPSRLQYTGFDQRLRRGIGHFLWGPELAHVADRDLRIVLATHFPGVRIVPGQDMVSHYIFNRRGSHTLNDKPCPVQVYLDGVFLQGPVTRPGQPPYPPPPPNLDEIRTDDLAGMEYYDGVNTPAAYRRLGSDCGVLLLWSKW